MIVICCILCWGWVEKRLNGMPPSLAWGGGGWNAAVILLWKKKSVLFSTVLSFWFGLEFLYVASWLHNPRFARACSQQKNFLLKPKVGMSPTAIPHQNLPPSRGKCFYNADPGSRNLHGFIGEWKCSLPPYLEYSALGFMFVFPCLLYNNSMTPNSPSFHTTGVRHHYMPQVCRGNILLP